MRPGERELVLNDGPPAAASDPASATIEVEIAPDDIDGDFVPRARHDVAWVQVDKETCSAELPRARSTYRPAH